MSRYIQEGRWRPAANAWPRWRLSCLLISCAKIEIAPHLRPLSSDAMMLLGKKGMDVQAPIFIRIYKEESELEVWKLRDDGRYYHYKTYPICTWSGALGPSTSHGDRQAPEGFYTITREQMNPDSKHHLAFNLGYPNAYDKAHRRTRRRADGARQVLVRRLLRHDRCADGGDLQRWRARPSSAARTVSRCTPSRSA